MRSMIRREWGWIYVLWSWFWILRRYTTILWLPVIGIGLERARRRAYIYICESACVDDSRYYRISYRYICTNKQRCCMRDISREGRTWRDTSCQWTTVEQRWLFCGGGVDFCAGGQSSGQWRGGEIKQLTHIVRVCVCVRERERGASISHDVQNIVVKT